MAVTDRSSGHRGGLALAVLLIACAPPTRPGPLEGVKGGLRGSGVTDPAGWQHQLRPRQLALTIGIDQFADPAWRPLRYAARDATEVAARLGDSGLGRFDEVTALVQQEQTTREGIRQALAGLIRRNLSAQDTVVVYLSSHGTLARDRQGQLRRYLVTRDTRLADVPGTGLDVDELRRQFATLRSERKVLILATCHSGAGKSALPRPIAEELRGVKAGFFVPPLEAVSRASVIIGVCSFGETAQEDPRLGHDIYTYFLLEALQRGDRNGDGAVTVTEAHEHARGQTYYFTQGRQRPQVESDILGVDPIVLSGRITNPGQPSLFSFRSEHEGVRLVIDGQTKGALPGSFVLPQGEHQVRLEQPGGQVLAERRLTLDAGQQLEVDHLLAPAPPPGDEHRPAGRWRLGPCLGYSAAFGPAGAAEELAASTHFGLAVGRSLPAALAGGAEVTVATGSQQATLRSRSGKESQTAAGFLEVGAGLGVVRNWQVGPLQLGGGPRLQLLWVRRTFDLPGLQRAEQGLVWGPGLQAGLRWELGPRLSLSLTTAAHYLPVEVDGTRQDLLRIALWLGLERWP